MSNRRRLLPYLYLVIGAAFIIGWPSIQEAIWGPPVPKVTTKQLLGLVGGNGALIAEELDARQLTAERNSLALGAGPMVVAAEDVGARRLIAAEIRANKIAAEKAKERPAELFAMGHGEKAFNLQVLANSQG